MPTKEKSEKSEKQQKQEKIDTTIFDYLVSLCAQLKEKQLFSFWAFPDRESFKKINKKTSDDIKIMIKKDLKKYKSRQIAQIRICTLHDAKPDSFCKKNGIWLSVSIVVYGIDADGILGGKGNKQSWSTHIRWEEKDFRCSKITFKLLERLMRLTASKDCVYSLLGGVPLSYIVDKLKKKNINLDDVLTPLAGI